VPRYLFEPPGMKEGEPMMGRTQTSVAAGSLREVAEEIDIIGGGLESFGILTARTLRAPIASKSRWLRFDSCTNRRRSRTNGWATRRRRLPSGSGNQAGRTAVRPAVTAATALPTSVRRARTTPQSTCFTRRIIRSRARMTVPRR
jgi:hypothetical protein